MATIEVPQLDPAAAAAKALAFIEGGVTKEGLVPNALITIRGRHRFGIDGARGTRQEANVRGLEEAYREGGALFMAGILRWQLEDPDGVFPLPEEAGALIEIFDPNTYSGR